MIRVAPASVRGVCSGVVMGPAVGAGGRDVFFADATLAYAFDQGRYKGPSGQVVTDLGALGPELVVNGGFASDLSGWIDSSSAPSSISWSAGAMVLTRITGNNARADQAIPTVAGRTYLVTFTSSGTVNVSVGTTQGTNGLFSGALSSGAAAYFTATGATSWVRLFTAVDGTLTVDNVSVREVPTGFQFTRTGAGAAEDTSGVYASFATNLPRRTNKGLLVEEGRTNKCTNTNANPQNLTNVSKSGDAASTLSVVDDSAALAAAGLSAYGPNVYKLDNTAGSSAAFAQINGTAGNTNAHQTSLFARGTGTVAFRFRGIGATPVAINSGYARKTFAVTPSASGDQTEVRADPGCVVYFILNQLEEGSFPTSPILTTGAAATRGADNAKATIDPIPASGPFAIFVDAVWPANVLGTQYAVSFNDGTTTNRLGVSRDATGQVVLRSTVGGVDQFLQGKSGFGGAARMKAAILYDGANYRSVFPDGTTSTVVAGSVPTTSQVEIGTQIGVSPINGFVRSVVVHQRDVSLAEAQAWVLSA